MNRANLVIHYYWLDDNSIIFIIEFKIIFIFEIISLLYYSNKSDKTKLNKSK